MYIRNFASSLKYLKVVHKTNLTDRPLIFFKNELPYNLVMPQNFSGMAGFGYLVIGFPFDLNPSASGTNYLVT